METLAEYASRAFGLVDRALARLYAQPACFVWRRE
jgi:hypothetical protein